MKKIMMLILILASFFVLTAFTLTSIQKTDEKSQEEICRASIVANHEAGLNLGVTKLEVPIQCYTYERKLPLDSQEKTVDGVRTSIGELAAKCWYMFGEGAFKETLDYENTAVSWKNKPCHVCYQFTIEDKGLKGLPSGYKTGDVIIKGVDLDQFLDDTIYLVEPEYHEMMCNNNEDDDNDGKIDAEDTDCQGDNVKKYNSNCAMRGGECVSGDCPDGTKGYKNTDWSCRVNNENCCIPDDRSFTYLEYIQEHGDAGRLFLSSSPNDTTSFIDFKSTGDYAVVIVEPYNVVDARHILIDQLNPIYELYRCIVTNYVESNNLKRIYYVYIGEYSSISSVCNVMSISKKI